MEHCIPGWLDNEHGWTISNILEKSNKIYTTRTTVNGKQYDQGKATDIAIVDGKVVVVGMLTGDYLKS